VWFRQPTERTVDWAGDPRKQLTVDASGAPRLSPRGSFALWRETVRGRSLPWKPVHIDAASSLRKVLLGGVRKRAVELREMNRRLSDADRTKDAFIAAVSHELRTPLNAITGWTHLLQSGSLPADRFPQAVEVIARNAKTQAQIVDDLLDISRITSGKLTLNVQSVDLVRTIDEVLQSSMLSLEAKGLRLKRALDSTATPVMGDVTRLRQIVFNLVTNAVKFTPKGGSVTVVLQRSRSDVELIVADNGQGIAADFLPHVFEPFRQGSEGLSKGAGLGLGLAIVKKLVELHGGQVSAESPGADQGATFRVRLPVAPVVQPVEAGAAAPSRDIECPPELDGLDVLVVEDEADAIEMLRIVLVRCGARVVEATRADDALAELAARRFDLVISDIGLPGMDGLEFMRELRRREAGKSRTPAIALTAYTRGVDRTRALQAGFSAHVPKPIDANELVTVAASVVGRLP
jgi:signal transduction histidine kinase